ncbi:MAG: hypothetical protein HGA45_20630 [Chloroflexales bacterium]|nr:hypothetical protein [Chloroflexales bacterium]
MAGQPAIRYTVADPTPTQKVVDAISMGTAYGIDAYELVISQVPSVTAPLPGEIIDPSAPFTVTLRFRIGGGTGFIVGNNYTGSVNFYYEGLGGGMDGVLAQVPFGTQSGTFNATSNAVEYVVATTIPSLPPPPSPRVAGLYKISAAVDLSLVLGGVTVGRLLAFTEGPLVQVY